MNRVEDSTPLKIRREIPAAWVITSAVAVVTSSIGVGWGDNAIVRRNLIDGVHLGPATDLAGMHRYIPPTIGAREWIPARARTR